MKIGLDVGRSGVKACTSNQRLLALPVVCEVSPEDRQVVGDPAYARENGTVYLDAWSMHYDAKTWLIGERVEALGLPGQYPMTVSKATPLTRVLILGAVTALGSEDRAEICLALPLHRFRQEGAAMVELLRGAHRVVVEGRERRILLLGTMACEGIGIWMRSVCDDPSRGPNPGLIGQRTVVLDFGHRTVQASVITRGMVRHRPYVSTHGSAEVWEAAVMQVAEGAGGTVFETAQRAALVAALLRAGVVNARGRTITREDVAPLLRVEARALWPRFREEIRRMLEGVSYERVVAGGGGVHLFAEGIQELFEGRALLLGDRFAQAEGCRLYLEYRSRL